MGLFSQDQAESQCPLTMSKQRDHLRSASHVTLAETEPVVRTKAQWLALLFQPNHATPAAGGHSGTHSSHQPRFFAVWIHEDTLVCVCVYLAGEQGVNSAGLWQPSCPSARLIMQERRSRPRSLRLGAEPGLHASPITWPRPSLFSSLYPGRRIRATAPRMPGISSFPLFPYFCCPFFPSSVGVRR